MHTFMWKSKITQKITCVPLSASSAKFRFATSTCFCCEVQHAKYLLIGLIGLIDLYPKWKRKKNWE